VPTTILGKSVARLPALIQFTTQAHPQVDVARVASGFLRIAAIYGIRGDVAYCQASLETDGFAFGKGTAVTPSQYNYGGLGVTRKGLRGESFPTPEAGVTAFMQHLFAYATPPGTSLPKGEILYDRRFTLVRRGSATTFDALSGKWATDPDYGQKITNLYARLLSINAELLPEDDVTPEDLPKIAQAVIQKSVNVPGAVFDEWTIEHILGWQARALLELTQRMRTIEEALGKHVTQSTVLAEIEAEE
jgi:Mannosyl-glycoprotein endo-beta-N-acetylglucosaminidase